MKKSISNLLNLAIYISIIILLVFLPFSSWLVSISGVLWISLIRDLLVIIIFILATINWCFDRKDLKRLILPILFIIWGLLSFYWKDTGIGQWARGFRYVFMPFVLYCSLSMVDLKEKQKILIYKVVLIMGLLIVFLAGLEFLGVKLPLISKYSGVGKLNLEHYVGGISTVRLQSILAGPNALGFYMLALVAWSVGSFKKVSSKYWVWIVVFLACILLTFSRSAFLGAMIIILISISEFLYRRFGMKKTILAMGSGMILLILIGFALYSNLKLRDYVLHSDSNNIRKIQYERIWSERKEIGLLGKGVGTAGLATQYQTTGTVGTNHWTENTYLDIFEQLGLVGVLLFIGSLGSILFYCLYNYGSLDSKSSFKGILAFMVAGLFVSMYTGQVGIYLILIISGIVTYEHKKEKN